MNSLTHSAPPVRTAEALLDHVRSLHADAVADGADASPLVLLATTQRFPERVPPAAGGALLEVKAVEERAAGEVLPGVAPCGSLGLALFRAALN